jgi:hypothetical protein
MNNTMLVIYWSALMDKQLASIRNHQGRYCLPFSLPNFIKVYNSRTECDMTTGPCSCGAWHYFGEIRK